MRRELKRWDMRCDQCGYEETYYGFEIKSPPGWGEEEAGAVWTNAGFTTFPPKDYCHKCWDVKNRELYKEPMENTSFKTVVVKNILADKELLEKELKFAELYGGSSAVLGGGCASVEECVSVDNFKSGEMGFICNSAFCRNLPKEFTTYLKVRVDCDVEIGDSLKFGNHGDLSLSKKREENYKEARAAYEKVRPLVEATIAAAETKEPAGRYSRVILGEIDWSCPALSPTDKVVTATGVWNDLPQIDAPSPEEAIKTRECNRCGKECPENDLVDVCDAYRRYQACKECSEK